MLKGICVVILLFNFSILNKLTPEFFEELVGQLLNPDMQITSSVTCLESVVKLIYEKGFYICFVNF